MRWIFRGAHATSRVGFGASPKHPSTTNPAAAGRMETNAIGSTADNADKTNKSHDEIRMTNFLGLTADHTDNTDVSSG
jgi:hypothetical protein